MNDLFKKLRVMILDAETTTGSALKVIIQNNPLVEKASIFTNAHDAKIHLQNDGFNSIFIDIFSIGTEIGIKFIEHVRLEYPAIPICLYSESNSLTFMPGVNDYWKSRFSHYYFLFKDQTIQKLDKSSNETLISFTEYLETALARLKLTNIRTYLSETSAISSEEKKEIEEVTQIVEKVLERKAERSPSSRNVLPGINSGQIEQLVMETIQEAKHSLQTTTYVNVGVLITGSALVIVSFIVAVVTNRWEAVAFGGFGMAGIVASLVTNPLRSISLSARRLVQVQVAYLSFLSQLSILNRESNETNIEISKQLGDEMTRTLKTLEEYFDK